MNDEYEIDAVGYKQAVDDALVKVWEKEDEKWAALAIGTALMWIAEELHYMNTGGKMHGMH